MSFIAVESKGLKLGSFLKISATKFAQIKATRSLIVRYFNPVTNNTVYFAVHGARFGEGILIEVNTREGRRRTSISSETMNN